MFLFFFGLYVKEVVPQDLVSERVGLGLGFSHNFLSLCPSVSPSLFLNEKYAYALLRGVKLEYLIDCGAHIRRLAPETGEGLDDFLGRGGGGNHAHAHVCSHS